MSSVPSVLDSKKWQIILLSILYFCIGLFSLILFFLSLRMKTNIGKRSSTSRFRCSILFMLSFLCFFRSVFFFVHDESNYYFLYFCYYLIPLFVEFLIFSFFMLFITQKIYQFLQNEKTYKKIVLIYSCLTIIIFSTWIIVSVVEYKNKGEDDFQNEVSRFSTIVFAFLVVILGGLAIKMFLSISHFNIKPKQAKRLKIFFALVILYEVIFIVRAIWSFLGMFNKSPLNQKIDYWDKHHTDGIYTTYLIWYLIFEIVPSVVLTISFWWNINSEKKSAQKLSESAVLINSHKKDQKNYQSGVNTSHDLSRSEIYREKFDDVDNDFLF
ncbi:tobamovirus multiplication protein 1-like isoform x1 [Anaeramoeba ignava]|uniref:Tobamovirus multiplication protein 1-like isoform x1 n=1 Tax=Anaeramoeba ignava TaxID=1746090 RepID=A0A9Q0RES8_ANAIG|nr:tobamovirus multiplication protein 1-like isoform x1 [Anaeramoeba ignava]